VAELFQSDGYSVRNQVHCYLLAYFHQPQKEVTKQVVEKLVVPLLAVVWVASYWLVDTTTMVPLRLSMCPEVPKLLPASTDAAHPELVQGVY